MIIGAIYQFSIYFIFKLFRECGCGEGDAGCTICGCCRICAREVEDNSELALLGPNGAGDIAGMMRLDVIFGIGGIRDLIDVV